MKIRIPLLATIAAIAALAFSSCAQTPQQLTADAVYASGYAAANDNLTHNPNLLPMIQDVAAKIPKVFTGGLSDNDLGVLNKEVGILAQNTTYLKAIVPADSSKLDQALSFLAGLNQAINSTLAGKAPTMDQVAGQTVAIQFANGLTGGIGYWQGANSVVAPAHP